MQVSMTYSVILLFFFIFQRRNFLFWYFARNWYLQLQNSNRSFVYQCLSLLFDILKFYFFLTYWRSYSNSSLLECSLPTAEVRPPGFCSRPGHVSLGCFSRGWRWPWSSLFIIRTRNTTTVCTGGCTFNNMIQLHGIGFPLFHLLYYFGCTITFGKFG